ncbi:hypothetical protein GIX45_07810 [Erwinia sp. CPCC 100877]|nr:hypothetical protein [Erwinia sp. CPCC 100877]
MKFKVSLLVVLLLLVGGGVGGFYNSTLLSNRLTYPTNCKASISIYKNQYYIPAFIIFNGTYEKGSIYIDGPIYSNNTNVGRVVRRISYKGTFDENVINLINLGITSLSDEKIDDGTLSEILPDFFYKTGEGIIFETTSNKKGLILIRDDVPFLYCKKR